jgi:YesN/AraC family two-component response regulator
MKTPFDEIMNRLNDLNVDKAKLRKAYDKLDYSEEKKIESATEIVTILIKYILLEHMIEMNSSSEFENILNYINEYIVDKITVQSICKKFFISKNTLYALFQENLNCSVKTYILHQRIEYAEQLLKTTELSIKEINEACGIDNYTYFCRLFKEKKGATPLHFRKNWKTSQKNKLEITKI